MPSGTLTLDNGGELSDEDQDPPLPGLGNLGTQLDHVLPNIAPFKLHNLAFPPTGVIRESDKVLQALRKEGDQPLKVLFLEESLPGIVLPETLNQGHLVNEFLFER